MQDTKNDRSINKMPSETGGSAAATPSAATSGEPRRLSEAGRRRLLRRAVRGALYVALGWVLGGCRMAFGTYPLGVAVVCAVPGSGIVAVLGAVASAFALTDRGGLLTGALLIALALRLLARLLLDRVDMPEDATPTERIRIFAASAFGESPQLRMTAGAVCGFLTGLYSLVGGGFRYYDLFGAVFSILFTPLVVLAVYHGLEGGGRRRTIGRVALMCALTFALRETTLLGVSVAVFGLFFAVLCISSRRGTVMGAAVGLICGVVLDPVCTPIFVLAAIIQGLLGPLSTLLSVGTALCSALLWGLYMNGLSALTQLLPGLVLAASAYCGASRVGWLERGEAFLTDIAAADVPPETSASRMTVLDSAAMRLGESETRLLDMSAAFESLSQVFYELSDRVRRPGRLDLGRVCDGVLDRHCPGCPRRELCWGIEYGLSLELVAQLTAALSEHGHAAPEQLAPRLRTRCRDIDVICREANVELGRLTEAALRSEKLGLFALDYESVSRLLCEAVEEQRQEYSHAELLTAAVGRALEAMGLSGELTVYGGRRRVIKLGLDIERAHIDGGRLRSCLEAAVGCRLEEPVFELSEGRVTTTLTTRRRCAVARAGLRLPAVEGDACGDSMCMFEDGRDRFYALLSDGMGSGSEAAFCSGLVTAFLERMLSAGNGVETSLRMLNSVLRSKGGGWSSECSATVDLLTLDLLDGRASVIKSGAAPTYVRRGGDVFRLGAETVPLGILGALDARRTSLELLCGDVVIMVSDGVSDAAVPPDGAAEDGSSPEWLEDVLSLEWDDDLDVMARRIVGRAQSVGGRGDGHDDLSVLLVRVEDYR